ncbi:MAG: hypothetical protein CVT64_11190 [Actinobacteria bacterium HGW-Actinobacteria-4]|nr:MAG: hypothetical protein CVT64_11190 [Actinobacteria bacterium HGW-Actinobacteria-4]
MTVLGMDACRGGWVAIAVDERGYVGGLVESSLAKVEAEAIARWGVTTIVIDIPIGLPDNGSRTADTEARRFIQPRGSSVFPTPVRAALESESYAEARVASVARSGKSLSAQAYAMRERILDVDSYVNDARVRVLEGHPEVSFRAMSGAALLEPKKTLEGAMLRTELLAGEGIVIPPDVRKSLKPAALDDILDAASMAWTALRVEAGTVESFPRVPELFSDGTPSAIWF